MYRVSPAGGSPDCVVFLHGWGLSPRSYRELLEEFARAGYSVIAPALPGFGGSAGLSESSRDTFTRIVDRIAGALDAEGALDGAVPFVGHSLGAGVAVGVSRSRPDLVSDLVLLCPVGGGSTGANAWMRLANGFRHEVGQHPLSRLVDALPSFVMHPAGTLASGVAAKDVYLVDDIRAIVDTGRSVAVVVADDDGVVATDTMREIPGVIVVDVAGAHGWPLADPAGCVNVVAGLL